METTAGSIRMESVEYAHRTASDGSPNDLGKRPDDFKLLLLHQDFPELVSLASQVKQARKLFRARCDGASDKLHRVKVRPCLVTSPAGSPFDHSEQVLQVITILRSNLLDHGSSCKILRGTHSITDSLMDDMLQTLRQELIAMEKIEMLHFGGVNQHPPAQSIRNRFSLPNHQNVSSSTTIMVADANHSQSAAPIATKYTKQQTDILMKWMINNVHQPFPSSADIYLLMDLTGLSHSQVVNWTTNVRKRNRKATCEQRKKPHHFLDFLFWKQHVMQQKASDDAQGRKNAEGAHGPRDGIRNKRSAIDITHDDPTAIWGSIGHSARTIRNQTVVPDQDESKLSCSQQLDRSLVPNILDGKPTSTTTRDSSMESSRDAWELNQWMGMYNEERENDPEDNEILACFADLWFEDDEQSQLVNTLSSQSSPSFDKLENSGISFHGDGAMTLCYSTDHMSSSSLQPQLIRPSVTNDSHDNDVRFACKNRVRDDSYSDGFEMESSLFNAWSLVHAAMLPPLADVDGIGMEEVELRDSDLAQWADDMGLTMFSI